MNYRAWLSKRDTASPYVDSADVWIDITDDLAKLYDLVVGSMDWGSGFLDGEDEDTVIKIGVLCGFEVPLCQEYYSWYASSHAGRVMTSQLKLSGKCTKHRRHDGPHSAQLRYSDPTSRDVETTPVEITWET